MNSPSQKDDRLKAKSRRRYQDLSSFRLPDGFRGRSALIVQLWWLVEATLFAPSPQFLYGWRRFLLRLFGARVGRKVLLRPSMRVTYPWKVAIGDHSWIGDDVTLYSLGPIIIGAHSVVSQGSYLCTGSHDMNAVDFPIYEKNIRIGDEVWIASQSFVGPGVSIGDGAVVGARSLVLADVPAAAIGHGHPFCVLRWHIDQTQRSNSNGEASS